MEIREYKKEDCQFVKNLLVQLQEYVIEIDKFNLNILSPEYREKYFAFLLQDCINQSGKIFVAEENGQVLGMIAGFVQEYCERDSLDYICPKKGIVAELIVSSFARAKGIGAMLLNKMENYFKSLNCEYVQIDVFAYNESAKSFYKKHGFEERMITYFKKMD